MGPQAIPQYNGLINLIATIVEPTAWMEGTGPQQGLVAIRAQSLVISQTAPVHEQIARLLAGLRKVRDAQRAQPPDLRPIALGAPIGSQSEAKLARRVEEQTQCDFHERPLAAAIRYFAERHRIEISIDDDCVSDSGTELTTPVTLKTNGILLHPPCGRCWNRSGWPRWFATASCW